MMMGLVTYIHNLLPSTMEYHIITQYSSLHTSVHYKVLYILELQHLIFMTQHKIVLTFQLFANNNTYCIFIRIHTQYIESTLYLSLSGLYYDLFVKKLSFRVMILIALGHSHHLRHIKHKPEQQSEIVRILLYFHCHISHFSLYFFYLDMISNLTRFTQI